MYLEQDIIEKVPLFKENEKKELFLSIVGALSLRVISLRKAAELLELNEYSLLEMLDSVGVSFSYLQKDDVSIERSW
jgi:predicted HTH domain antitoxin